MEANFSNHYYTVVMGTYQLDKLVFSGFNKFKIQDIFDLSEENIKAHNGRTMRVTLVSQGPASHQDRKRLGDILGGVQHIKTGIFVG